MDFFQTIIIAIVEGLSEFLPISSTGHMIIAQKLLGVESTDFVKAFTVNIQFGAILSVVVLYWKRFFKINAVPKNAFDNQKGFQKTWSVFSLKFDFYIKLFVAFIPAAIIGFLANDYIDEMLDRVDVVAVSLVLGGIFMLFIDKWFAKTTENQDITYPRAWKIGLAQCISMIPGVSRSMATIVGGMANKLSRKNAAEFSFFLAVPTMLAASGYKLLKLVNEPNGVDLLLTNLPTLLIGNLVAFVVAMAAIKFFISFLTKYGFKAFGYYRIVVGIVILIMLASGINLEIS
ncbi:MAG: undecaprenyl-diphosphate phosphatase [Paludibacteraceae bacterium]|nr:undecaprenyl-diphosphate phosphatase [Paludibacteraceae bacterium]MBN2786980.1 undecaprenyl-diphosphate phosphatase [Paludibacteraceae bacterium]